MSSFRRSHHQGPTQYDYQARFENRNSEDVHREALAASYAEHQRVREFAVRAAQLEEARLEQLRLQQLNVQEEERVRLEEERVREEIRLRNIQNREKQIPKPPARVPTPPPADQQGPVARTAPTQPPPAVQTSASKPLQNPFQSASLPTTQGSNPFAPSIAQKSNLAQPSLETPYSSAPAQQQSTTNPPLLPPTSSPIPPEATSADKYVQIHQKLKKLRKYVNGAGSVNVEFKKKVGDLRRTIRMAVGQCVKDKSKNKEPVNKIMAVMQQALTSVPSPGIDPSDFMLSSPDPVEGAVHNGPQLPALFIFLLNYFAKYVVSQFLNEAGVNTEIADPIGVVAVQIFSRNEYLWRGQSLIDILMAKVRVTCPVLFGIRANEATEAGRARLGWKRDGSGAFMSEDQHSTRMTGISAGYAAISLRDFSKSRLKNPWHPTHYWETLASIVSTPPDERSSTQYVVLRSMIDGFEATFLKFYGNAGRAALKFALVTFPGQAGNPGSTVLPGTSAVGGVTVLADRLANQGIELRV